MIWDPKSGTRDSNSQVAARIADEITAACGHGSGVCEDSLEQVALAVADYIDGHDVGTSVDSNRIVMLVSKALSSLGEGHAARRLVLLGTGLVRPSEWEVTDNRTMWVLDLKRIAVWNVASLEMVFFSCLQVILDAIADIWDESDGQGTLGLRHVCATASAMQGRGKHSVPGFAEEIKDLCRRKLTVIGRKRGWRHTPRVMDLDLRQS